MSKHFTAKVGGIVAMLGVCWGFLWAQGAGVNADILKLAGNIKKGNNVRAPATAIAKANDLDDIMYAFKPRSRKGIGIGRVPGKVLPDGIELMLQSLEKAPPGPAMMANVNELDEMANVVAAVGEIALDKPNAKGKKIMKQWIGWTKELKENGAELAKAIGNKDAKGISKLAGKINATCSACHIATKD